MGWVPPVKSFCAKSSRPLFRRTRCWSALLASALPATRSATACHKPDQIYLVDLESFVSSVLHVKAGSLGTKDPKSHPFFRVLVPKVDH